LEALRTYRVSYPDLKSPVLDGLSRNSPLAVTAVENGFSALAAGGWVWTGHLAGPGEVETDHVAVALRFLGAPYRWGGRSSIGLDCSGLVQMALARCGKASPRDSDMQACESGAPVAFDGDYSVLRYGDHVIWPGHCGLYLDKDRFVHANATDMMVAIAPLAKVAKHIERIEGHRISAVRRP
jgi:cell wall-associated NlpC family hydrolase